MSATATVTEIREFHAHRGGHFAGLEEPELFATEMRAAFESLRDEGSSS